MLSPGVESGPHWWETTALTTASFLLPQLSVCNVIFLFGFRCLINCGVKISPSVKVSVQSECQGSQCHKIDSYEWVLHQQNQSAADVDIVWRKREDLQHLASTPLNSSDIVIKENSLDGGEIYRLVLYVKTTDGLPGMSAYDISTASPPSGGTCTITPSSGISLKTNFNLTCSNWTSDVTPLTYQFRYQLGNGLYSVIYHGENNSIISWLPPGNQSDNNRVKFVVTVTDKYGASAPAVSLTVRVSKLKWYLGIALHSTSLTN